jgi:hypothetical protein
MDTTQLQMNIQELEHERTLLTFKRDLVDRAIAIAQRDLRIGHLENDVAERDARIAELEAILVTRDTRITHLEGLVARAAKASPSGATSTPPHNTMLADLTDLSDLPTPTPVRNYTPPPINNKDYRDLFVPAEQVPDFRKDCDAARSRGDWETCVKIVEQLYEDFPNISISTMRKKTGIMDQIIRYIMRGERFGSDRTRKYNPAVEAAAARRREKLTAEERLHHQANNGFTYQVGSDSIVELVN